MRKITLEEDDTIEIAGCGIRIYLTLADAKDERFKYGFQIRGDRNLTIKPRMENSVLIIPELSDLQRSKQEGREA